MSKRRNPTPAERRAAAHAPTETSATGFILRLGPGPWLKREAPFVVWGPQSQAVRFKTKGEARAAVTRLASHGALTIEEITD